MTRQLGIATRTRPVGPRLKRSVTPYAYLFPTMLLMALLMIVPMAMVIQYSMMDNVITYKHPQFVGFENYVKVFSDEVFLEAAGHTLYFTVMSVIFHMVVGLLFALMLNSKLLGSVSKAIFRTIYVTPWMFTATIVAILWRLLLDPGGVLNYIMKNMHIIDSYVEWFGSSATALNALTFVNIWAGYPFYMVSLLRGFRASRQTCTRRR
jgi:multiple sugar transport system permease protein